MPPDLRVSLGPLALRNPLICGSGEHVATLEDLLAAVNSGAAGVIAKSANETEAGRRQWEAAQRTFIGAGRDEVDPDASATIFNRSGLVPQPWSEWVDTLARADAHARERESYVAASVIPGDAEELPALAADVERAGLRWLELNLSAPHAGEAEPGAIETPSEPARASALTAAVRGATTIALSVKLPADGADVVALARAVREAGADAVVLTGRQLGFMPDLETRKPVLGTFGAASGPWSLPIALRWVAKTRLALGPDVPLVGTNGARDGGDVARFLLAGARAVQVATCVIFEGFGAIGRMLGELSAYLDEQGVDARDIVGEAADAVMTYEEAALRSSR
jgi:dihydropyrimidine dehydrogenase (NAD+) subunit PreA/dihydroorotate dehydrogenase (NAD+) catalytic subunit